MSVEAQNFCRPLESLRANRARSTTGATPPDRDGHYPHAFLWDSMFHAIVMARFGAPQEAAWEIKAILHGQDAVTGFVPNMRFGRGRRLDLERLTFSTKGSSNYTQPPLFADAALHVLEAYEAIDMKAEGTEFLKEIYPRLKSAYFYFLNTRLSTDSNLIGVIHPHETGRDSGPEFDSAKKRFGQPGHSAVFVRGAADKLNTVADFASALFINVKHRANGWQINERAKDIFWVEDVMFNCIYAQNLKFMSSIAQFLGLSEDAGFFEKQHKSTVAGIEQALWEDSNSIYWARDGTGKHIKVMSVSNIFPITLPDIEKSRVEAILELLEDPRMFNTPYPIPSVPVDSKAFDPDYSENRLWRGPTWMNMNWYVARGLLAQRDRFAQSDLTLALRLNRFAHRVAERSVMMVDREGYREFYHPIKGRGMRVRNFGWSTLADVLKLEIAKIQDFETRVANLKKPLPR